MPTAKDAIRLVEGKVCLVDGTITPCWSYAEHRELWSRRHGTPRILRPADRPAGRHPDLDFRFTSRPDPRQERVRQHKTTDIIKKALAGIGDKGYQ